MPIDYTCPYCGHPTRVADAYAGQTGPCSACEREITLPTLDEAQRQRKLEGGQRPRHFGLLMMVAGIGFIGLLMVALLMALVIPFQNTSHAQTRIQTSQNNLRQIMLAMQSYQSDYGSLPPAYAVDEQGQPMHSWRVLLLPYVEQSDLYEQYDLSEPWDGPNNSLLHDEFPHIYQSPSDVEDYGATSYMVVVGERTLFPPKGKAASYADVADGLSRTIAVVEVYDSQTHWMKPADLEFDSMSMVVNDGVDPGIASGETSGANVALADGAVREVSEDTGTDQIRAALTRNGREPIMLPP